MKKLITVVMFSVLCLPAQRSAAGTGRYVDASPDEIELRVLFMYDESDPKSWEPMFEEASKLLFNATEHQVRFSKVTFYDNCPEAEALADVKIYDDTMGANANTGGLGRRGFRIRLSSTHKTVTTSGSGDRGQFGLVHELGHYAFGLLDEYLDKNGDQVSDAYCIDKAGTSASIMDGGTTVDPTNRRTEFCWSGNHRAGHTNQDTRRAIGSMEYEDTDSWTWLAAFVHHRYGATLTLPTADPEDDVTGYGSAPVFEHRDCGLRAVLCIDRSGSMATAAPLRLADGASPAVAAPLARSLPAAAAPIDLAKLGASSVVSLLEDRDRAAVVSFADSPRTDFAMAGMDSANKSAARSAISGIFASGSTNIGGGLATSLGQITGDGNAVGSEVVILLSDGMHNIGTPPGSVLPQLEARGVVVHTLGLGRVDASLMSNLAAKTGGSYLYATTAGQIKAHFIDLLSKARSEPLLHSSENELEPGETDEEAVYLDAHAAAAEATFLLSWADPAHELDLTVQRPDGSTVRGVELDAASTYDPDLALKAVKVSSPMVGEWHLSIGNPSAGSESYSLQVHTTGRAAMLAAGAEEPEVEYPRPLHLRASLQQDLSIAGAQVQAEIERPNRAAVRVSLYDDGRLGHGDDRPGDGIYSTLFRGFSGDGSYTVLVKGDSAGGMTTDGESEKGGTFTPEPVPRFVRENRFSVVVSGMAALDGDLDGVLDSDEDGAPGFGDLDGDGVADSDEPTVASLPVLTGGYVSLSLTGPGCEQLSGVGAGSPEPDIPGVATAVDVFSFYLECPEGRVELSPTALLDPSLTYRVLRYGSTPDDPSPRWYDFAFDGRTGAEWVDDRLVVQLVDGERGDDDVAADGVVTVGQLALVPEPRAPEPIPALSSAALAVLGLLLAASGWLWSRHR